MEITEAIHNSTLSQRDGLCLPRLFCLAVQGPLHIALLYEPKGVYRFLNAVKRAYPPFFDANRNLYRKRLPRDFPVPAYYTY
jgi:hypothetical protein